MRKVGIVLLILLGLITILSKPFNFFNVLLTIVFFACAWYLAKNPKKIVEPIQQNSATSYSYTNSEALNYVRSFTNFPEQDDHGMELLKILDDVKLTGVTKEVDGINPQDIIEFLDEGEEVFFKRIPMKKYPNATLVVDENEDPIGWIPEGFYYQEDIAKRLDNGTTVKARVSKILGGENGKNYGICIDIARYKKKRAKKENQV